MGGGKVMPQTKKSSYRRQKREDCRPLVSVNDALRNHFLIHL